jgi:RHS repeat-associated protein
MLGYADVLDDTMQSGIDALNNRNYSQATTLFYRAYNLAPDGTYLKEKSHFYLIKSCMKAGDNTRAKEEYAALKSRNADSPALDDLLFMFGNDALENRKAFSEAKPYLDELITNYPNSDYIDKALFQRMRVADNENDFEKVQECFSQLSSKHSTSPVMSSAYLRFAESLRNVKKDYKSAEKYYRYVADNYSTSSAAPQAQVMVAELWNGYLVDDMGNWRPDIVVKEARKVIDKWPHSRWSIQALYHQNMAYCQTGRRDKAREIANKVLADYSYKEYPNQYVHALYTLAFLDYMDMKWDKALTQFQSIVETYPDHDLSLDAWRQIIRIHYFQGKREQAKTELESFIAKYPDSRMNKEAKDQLASLNEIIQQKNSQLAKTDSPTVLNETNLCGPVALSMVLSHYGINSEIKDITIKSEHSLEGTSFAGLAKAAEYYGLDAKGYKLSYRNLNKLTLPLIVQLNHRQKDHFVTLEKITKKGVTYSDQQVSHQQMSIKEFNYQWTGYALALTPKGNIKDKYVKLISLIPLSRKSMETVIGGCAQAQSEGVDDCGNNQGPCPPCDHGPVTPGGGEGSGGPSGGAGFPFLSISSKGGSGSRVGIGGGAVYSAGGGSGNSATSLAVNSGNGWAFTVFPEISCPFSMPNGQLVVVSRSYSSSRYINYYEDSHLGNYGPGKPWGTLWTINFATHLILRVSELEQIYWVDEMGNQYAFYKDPSGIYYPGTRYGINEWITVNGTQYTLHYQDGKSYIFDDIGSNIARLTRIDYPDNYSVYCEYNNPNPIELTSIYTNPSGNGNRLNFTYTSGKLTSITDPFNRTVQYTYDSNSDLVQIQDPDGYCMDYFYNTYHQITAIRDSFSGSTNLYSYEYNRLDHHNTPQCTAIVDAMGNRTEIVNNTWWENSTVTVKDANGNTLKSGINYQFNSSWDKLISYSQNGNIIKTFYWAGNNGSGYGYITATQDAANRMKLFWVDYQYGHTTAVQDEMGNKEYSYFDNTLHVATCFVNVDGNNTFYEYNSARQPTKITDSLGNQSFNYYDSYSNLTASVDALGQKTLNFYNNYGYVTATISPSQTTTRFIYDTWGRRTEVINPLGYSVYYGYDTMFRPVWTRDALGGLTQIEYYSNGLLKQVKDAKNQVTSYEYDLRNRLIKETDVGGGYKQYWYDAFDKVTCRRDAKNQRVYYYYDNYNRLTTKIYQSGKTLRYYYDVLGNVTTINDPNIGLTKYQYNTLSQVTGYSNLYGSIEYAYNNGGQRTGLKDSDGNLYGYVYDALGRVQVIQNYTYDQWTQYAHDSIGRKTLEIYPNGLFTAYEYDTCACGTKVLGDKVYKPTDNFNRTSIGNNWASDIGLSDWGMVSTKLERIYDSNMGMSMITYSPAGSISVNNLEATLFPLATASEQNGYLVYEYMFNGIYGPSFRFAGYDLANGQFKIGHQEMGGSLVVDTSVTYGWAAGYPMRLRLTVSGNTATLWKLETSGYEKKLSYIYGGSIESGQIGLYTQAANTRFDDFIYNTATTEIARNTYTYDENGNRTSLTDINDKVTYYQYDALSRLTREFRFDAPVYDLRYSYDSVGNRTRLVNGTTTTYYAYNNLNQLTSSTTNGNIINYSYDSNGNQVEKTGAVGPRYYQWNEDNMMTQVSVMDYPIVDYTYDALGKRVIRSHYTANLIDRQTQYFFDGINILMERQRTINPMNGSWMDWQTSATYTLAPGVISHIISVHQSDGIDLYYHYDPIGNVMMISNASGDTIAGYYQEGFGNIKQTDGTADNNYHLTTKELDPDTGLYYFYARWYDPEIGRFISEDPIASINNYSYCFNNPQNRIDANGKGVFEILVGTAIVLYISVLGVEKLMSVIRHTQLMDNIVREKFSEYSCCKNPGEYERYKYWIDKAMSDVGILEWDNGSYAYNIAMQHLAMAECKECKRTVDVVNKVIQDETNLR